MADSIRQQLVDAVEARFNAIGYGKVFQLPDGPHTCTSTVAGVHPWRKTAFGKAETPEIRFRDTDADVNAGEVGKHERALRFELEAFVVKDTTASVARALLADMVAAIGSDMKWGGLARQTRLESEAIDLDQGGDVISGVELVFTIIYRTPLWRM